jgi:hypothetical protein
MKKQSQMILFAAALLAGGCLYGRAKPASDFSGSGRQASAGAADHALAEKFAYLSKHGNSFCSAAFRSSIASLPGDARLQGSCCAPMSLPRYREQIEGLKKFKSVRGQNVDKIPDDPYDLKAALARELMSYDEIKLTPAEQKAYDYAMQHSEEKGPCCCRCWRWFVYGGLAKYLIKNDKFSGKQIVQVWNLSDGCGGS